jgi:hypothetical protein
MWRNHASDLPGQELRCHEMERQRPDAATIGALQRAFEDVGVEFLPDDDVRVRAATPPDK